MDIKDKKLEEGSVSIESAIVLPIVIIVAFSLIKLLEYINVNDIVLNEETYYLINNQINIYRKSNILFDVNLFNNEDEIVDDDVYLKHNIKNDLQNDLQNALQNKLNNNSNNKFHNKRIKDRVLKNKNIKNYEGVIDETNDLVIDNVKYDFILPFSFINKGKITTNYNIKIRPLRDGDSIENYSLISNCLDTNKDIWKLKNIERAKEISNLLGGTTDFNGNTIDKVEEGRLVSIVSLDFRKKSYEEINQIVFKLKEDVRKLKNFKNGTIDGVEINTDDYNRKMLHLVIPLCEMEEYVEMELIKVKTYCKNNNIEFKITALKENKL